MGLLSTAAFPVLRGADCGRDFAGVFLRGAVVPVPLCCANVHVDVDFPRSSLLVLFSDVLCAAEGLREL